MPVPRKFCSENFLVSRTLTGFGILIKLGRGCGIKAEVFEVYLKGSILENAEKMGAPIPPLKNVLEKTQDSNDNTSILSL